MSDAAPQRCVLAIDPGRQKCGLAVVEESRRIRARAVVETGDLVSRVRELLAAYPVTQVIIGDRTGFRQAAASLRPLLGDRPLCPVDEHLSSVEARQRYFRQNPPRGLRRLIPLGLQVPPCPVDDWVAVVLAERFLTEGADAPSRERR